MPHISRKQLNKNKKNDLNKYMLAVIQQPSSKERVKIFKELITKTERLMIAKRLAILFLIEKKVPTHQISTTLGVSPSTVARFENLVDQGKYKTSIVWLKKNWVGTQVENFLNSFSKIIFPKRKSMSQLVDEL